VMVINPDPIGLGLARSLPRPGGNVTGVTTILTRDPPNINQGRCDHDSYPRKWG
jgi:ABC-type uncharacterized transport system substrate-binding protein